MRESNPTKAMDITSNAGSSASRMRSERSSHIRRTAAFTRLVSVTRGDRVG